MAWIWWYWRGGLKPTLRNQIMRVCNRCRPEAVRLPRFPSFRALAALLVLALRQQIRGWRLVVLGLLFLLPGALAVLVCLTSPVPSRGSTPAEVLDFTFLFNLIPHALAPLAALLCAGGIIRDEVEEQTLTYVLLRPLPRPAIYAIKLLAALLTAALLTSFFTVATLLLIALLTGESAERGALRARREDCRRLQPGPGRLLRAVCPHGACSCGGRFWWESSTSFSSRACSPVSTPSPGG